MKDYELLEAQARMMRMAEKYGVDDWRKLVQFSTTGVSWTNTCVKSCRDIDVLEHEYRFALGVVEGKPVFVGDTLWNVPNNFSFAVTEMRPMHLGAADCFFGGALNDRCGWVNDCSWNPPAPKTVMVEVSYDIAKFYADNLDNKLGDACRKALEAQSKK